MSEEVIKERNVWVSKDVWDTGDYLPADRWLLYTDLFSAREFMEILECAGWAIRILELETRGQMSSFCRRQAPGHMCAVSPDQQTQELWTREAKGDQVRISIIFKQPEQNTQQ